jgi:hypothetical protein
VEENPMTNKELIFNEGSSPLMNAEENLNFRRYQMYIYRTIFSLMDQNFQRENFIAKLQAFAGQIMFKTNGYFTCSVIESADYIRMAFYVTKHPMSRALYEIKYDC